MQIRPAGETAAEMLVPYMKKVNDRIVIGVLPEFDPATTEEEQRAYAREYASKCCLPGKPSMVSMYGSAFCSHGRQARSHDACIP